MSEKKKTSIKSKEQIHKVAKREGTATLIYMMPIILALALVPLLVGPYLDRIDPATAKYWVTSEYVSFYDHHSALAVIGILIFMIAVAFFNLKREYLPRDKMSKIIISLLLFTMLLTAFSSIFALSKDLALWGAPDRYEGLWVQLTYFLITIYILVFLKNTDLKAHINKAILFLSAIISILGISQMQGNNLLFKEPLNSFINIFSNANVKVAQGLNDPSQMMSITFGNSNYVGSYVALVLPLLIAMVCDKKNNKTIKTLAALLSIITIIILFSSRSQAGLVGLAAAFILFVIVNIGLLKRNKKKTLAITIGIFVLLLAGFFSLSEGNKWLIRNLGDDARAFFTINKKESEYDSNYGLAMYSFEIDGYDMKIHTVDGVLKLHARGNGSIGFSDENSNPILATLSPETNSYTLAEPFQNISYKYAEGDSDELEGIQLSYIGSNFILLENNFKEGIFFVDDRFNRIDLVHAPHWGFEGKEKLGSGRAYIWSRSIPILKNTLIKGYGPDNYILAFPQHDYWAKTYVYNNSQMITDKPHNMYLQWGINNGVLALISLLAVFVIYIFSSARELYRWKQSDPDRIFKIGIICAVVGYLIAGIFNDSVVSIAPIFWSLLGIGIAMMETGNEKEKPATK